MTAQAGRWAEVKERVERDRTSVREAAARDSGADASILEPAFDHILRLVSGPEISAEQVQEARDIGVHYSRSGVEARLVLDAYLSLSWAIWESATSGASIGRRAIVELADRLMKSIDRAIAAMADGYLEVEVELAAAHSERRRSVLEELLTAPRATPASRTRVRRVAQQHGLAADDPYRLMLVHVDGIQEIPDAMVDRLELHLIVPAPHHRRQPGIRLPVVLEWRGRILVVAQPGWAGEHRFREALSVLVGDAWVAVATNVPAGVEGLSEALAHAEFTVGVAANLGRRGWIADPGVLALETMYLLDNELSRAAIEQELGPLLANGRMGEELIETLEVYLASGQNSRETARRLHRSPRTVTYRLERIASLLGHDLDSEASLRLGAALLALRVAREAGRQALGASAMSGQRDIERRGPVHGQGSVGPPLERA
jgi:hypothetical protein